MRECLGITACSTARYGATRWRCSPTGVFRAPRAACASATGAETADGGPIAVLRDGDMGSIDARAAARSISVELSAEEIASRLAE